MGNRNAWQLQGLCRQEDPELFDTRGRSGSRLLARAATAKAICARCPVVEACLSWALSMEGNDTLGWRHGIWGASTPQERWEMHKKMKAESS
ncbi:WhiB family transcriptional regulator [Streptomyces virginiae]|uniref:WhiB family transcriptional regulator n=1 Tax=Streptomyces virginiae TaxID=1961 RepID=UPI0036933579